MEEPTKEELEKIKKNGIADFGEEISTMSEVEELREHCGVET